MIAPESLLRMHPLDALRAQIGERLKAPLQASYLKIEAPKAVSGVKTSVKVSIDKSKAPLDLWDRVGSFEFEYDRIDLNSFTSGLNKTVKAALPVTPQALLSNVFYLYGIPVIDSDLVDARYTTLGSADVIAADESYRWVGDVELTIAMLGIEILGLVMVNTFTFSFTADYRSADVKNRITTHFNLANSASLPTAVLPAMFTLGNPVVNNAEGEGDNTKIKLTFNGSPYIGSVDVIYGRRSFPDTFRWPVEITTPVIDTSALAPTLSTKLGCLITSGDLKAEPIPVVSVGQTVSFPVHFKETSLAYVGSILIEYTRTA